MKDGTVAFNLSLVRLLTEVDPIAEKQDCKKEALKAYGTGRIKMNLALLTEIVALNI